MKLDIEPRNYHLWPDNGFYERALQFTYKKDMHSSYIERDITIK